MVDALCTTHQQRAVPPLHKTGDEGEPLYLRRGYLVLAQETGQLAVRIENVAVLVGPVELARTQRPEQGERLVAGEQTRRENGDLALKHLVEGGDAGLAARRARGEAQDVVGMIEAVGTASGTQGVVDIGQRQVQQGEYVGGSHDCPRRR